MRVSRTNLQPNKWVLQDAATLYQTTTGIYCTVETSIQTTIFFIVLQYIRTIVVRNYKRPIRNLPGSGQSRNWCTAPWGTTEQPILSCFSAASHGVSMKTGMERVCPRYLPSPVIYTCHRPTGQQVLQYRSSDKKPILHWF